MTIDARAQIGFGGFYSGATLSIDKPADGDLDFGTVPLDDITSVAIHESPNRGYIEIEGVAFLDVIVSLTRPNQLLLNGDPCSEPTECSMALSLLTAYNNTDIVDNTAAAVTFSGTTVTFPIRGRTSGPPRPPDPDIEGISLPTASAFIYFYGSVTTYATNIAGSYSNTIIVDVEYY